MRITYEQLANLNLSKLDKAIEDWETAKRRAEELKNDAGEGLGKAFRAAGWESLDGTSEFAAKQVKDIEEECGDAHQVSNAVLGVLREVKRELASKKNKLADLVAAEEEKGDVSVSPTGKVTYKGEPPESIFSPSGGRHVRPRKRLGSTALLMRSKRSSQRRQRSMTPRMPRSGTTSAMSAKTSTDTLQQGWKTPRRVMTR